MLIIYLKEKKIENKIDRYVDMQNKALVNCIMIVHSIHPIDEFIPFVLLLVFLFRTARITFCWYSLLQKLAKFIKYLTCTYIIEMIMNCNILHDKIKQRELYNVNCLRNNT